MAKGAFAVRIDERLCKGSEGCGLCLAVCPEQVLAVAPAMNARGAHPARVAASQRCTGCGLCVLHCPDLAIWLESVVTAAGKAA